jgi:4-amino-4-deoxy-L-arabinose transferase-like glycosyltransferase
MSLRSLTISKEQVFLLAIFGVALAVRLWGISHDLPYNYYPDERHFVNRALAFGSGDLNPHWFHKPALYMYILFFEYGMYYAIGRIFGWFVSVDDFARHYFIDPSAFFLLGRMTTVIFAIATVYVTYIIGRNYYNRRVGLIAALFLAITFGHVRSSHFVLADVPATFFTVLAFCFLMRVVDRGATRDYFLVGLFAGLGTATKYDSVTLLPCLYLAHLLFHSGKGSLRWKEWVSLRVLGGIVLWGLGFFLGSPYNFLDPHWIKSLSYFAGEAGIPTGGHAILAKTERVLMSFAHMWGIMVSPQGIGLILGLLAILGIGYLLSRRRPHDIVLLSAPLSFFFIASYLYPSYAQSRHLNPVYPLVGLMAALGLDWLLRRRSLERRRWVPGVVCLLAILSSVYHVAWFDYRISQKETRTLAKEWVEANIPAGTRILLDMHGPALNWSRQSLAELYEQANRETTPGPFTTHLERYIRYQLETVGGVTYDITQIHHAWWKGQEEMAGDTAAVTARDIDFGNPLWKRGVMPLAFYQANSYRYIITTSEDYELYLNGPRRATFPFTHAFYRDLFDQATLVKEFHPDPWHRPGPVVKIFRLDSQS